MSKLIAQNVDFNISIDNNDFSYSQYRNRAYKKAFEILGHDYYDDNLVNSPSPIETLINARIKKVFGDDVIIFVTNYSERQGSFIITFSIFVFAAFMNYGSFRESLDYLRDDFNFFFRDTFSNNSIVSVNYSTRQNHTVQNLHSSLLANALSPLSRQIKILKGIIGFIGLFALGFAFYSVYKVENMSSQTVSNETIEQTVAKEVNRLNIQRTNEELLKLLEDLKNDTKKKDK